MLLIGVGAGAAIDGPCRGTATIDGIVYSEANDSADNPIVIPDQDGLIAFWEGSTDAPITEHTGELGVVIGPATINFADWGGENSDLETESSGSYAIDDARDVLPINLVGLYEVSGFHSGEGGKRRELRRIRHGAAGRESIDDSGRRRFGSRSRTGSGWSAFCREDASMSGRPVLGSISGLFLGLFAAVLLQQYGIRPLDTFSVIGLPIIGLVVGLLFSMWAPFGRR
jgi:hypothetical protein